MTVTQREIAAAVGVSPSTVSRYLRGQLRLSPELAQHIDEASRHARSQTGQNRIGAIGLVTPDLENPYFAAMAQAVAEAAAKVGIELLTLMTGSYAHRERNAVAFLAQRGDVEGVIYLGANPHNTVFGLSIMKDMPVVFLDEVLPVTGPKVARVTADNYGGAYSATTYLIRKGHRAIAHLGGPPELKTAEDRVRGYRDALTNHELEVNQEMIFRGAFSQQFGANFFAYVNRLDSQPTAVLSASDIAAIGVLQAARQLAVDIPENLSLISCDGTIVSNWLTPRLTTVQQPVNEMAKRAVEEINSMLAGNPGVSHALPMSLQIRESTQGLCSKVNCPGNTGGSNS